MTTLGFTLTLDELRVVSSALVSSANAQHARGGTTPGPLRSIIVAMVETVAMTDKLNLRVCAEQSGEWPPRRTLGPENGTAEIVSVGALALAAGTSTETVRAGCRDGRISATKVGRDWIIRTEEGERWLAERTT